MAECLEGTEMESQGIRTYYKNQVFLLTIKYMIGMESQGIITYHMFITYLPANMRSWQNQNPGLC